MSAGERVAEASGVRLARLLIHQALQLRLAKRARNVVREKIITVLLTALRLRVQLLSEPFEFHSAKAT